jgi:formamidopyrimidine-DNA glycosylase
VCRPHAPADIDRALRGHRFTAAHRQGKSIWLETDGGPALGVHLGMAGRIIVDGASAGDPHRGREDDPTWSRFIVRFQDGGTMVLFDKRRLGRIVLDPDLSRLGPDAELISRAAFRERVGRGEAPLKARIMDQSVLAGVGNLLADEALWRARLDPRRPAGSLRDEELDRLRRELRAAIRSAIRGGGVHTGAVIDHRRRGGVCPRCGGPMERATVGGRTTWWCAREQGDPGR